MTARPRKKREGVPLYLDMAGMCFNLSICESTVEEWVRLGLLPEPRLMRGKRMWKTVKVEAYIDGDGDQKQAAPVDEAERIREYVRQQLEAAAR